jgi:hypothetical protein
MTTERELQLQADLDNALELLHRYQSSETIRPAPDEPTGDHTSDKVEAERETRLSMLELGLGTRDRELTEFDRQLKDIKTVLDNLAAAVARLPCNTCPVHTPSLRPIAGGGE